MAYPLDMAVQKHLPDAVGGGLIALKEQKQKSQCETKPRMWMKAYDDTTRTVYYYKPDCKQWKCTHCARRMVSKWSERISWGGTQLMLQGHQLDFVTITMNAQTRTFKSGLTTWRAEWKPLAARMRYHGEYAAYVWIGEHKRQKHFHIHMINTCGLPVRWYKDNAVRNHMGHQCDVTPVTDVARIGAYMSKYMVKSLDAIGWPKHARRVNTSRNWPKLPAESEEGALSWQKVGMWGQLETNIKIDSNTGWNVKLLRESDA